MDGVPPSDARRPTEGPAAGGFAAGAPEAGAPEAGGPAPGGPAPGGPGIAPTWTSSAKDAVGTALRASRIWFTVGRGILDEVYWPRVDRPELRDLGFIVADDAGFWSEVKRDCRQEIGLAEPGIPAVIVRHLHERYELHLRICTDDHGDIVRIESRLTDPRAEDDPERLAHPLRLYPLVAPHVGFSGLENRAWVGSYKGSPLLYAQRGGSVLAFGSEPAPLRQSVGYVGTSDGWQDFARNGRMSWAYASTGSGNVAAMAEIQPRPDGMVEMALAFGSRPEEAGLLVRGSLAQEFDDIWEAYGETWREFQDACMQPPDELDEELRREYLVSAAVLRTHQDRGSPGATVASLSIPWGNTRNDLGGYHLVWSRDLVESAGALVALGSLGAARRTLAYLAASQEPDGHWVQNQWVDGAAYWPGVQLDEAAYPILLIGALRAAGARHMHGRGGAEADAFEHLLTEEALDRMVLGAAGFLARSGPLTQQDRWEEDAGLTPSTLAPVVAALVVAARFLPEPSATYALELADDWNAAIEEWTYVRGSQLAIAHGVDGHYVRIAAPSVLSGAPISTPVPVRNRLPPFDQLPGDELVGTDFLALVRFGLRLPDDPRIRDSLVVADAVLRTETPSGAVWHRYNGDGYGEHEDGSPFDGTGIGRGWPLLVGERGHLAVQAGEDARPYLRSMLRMASAGGMIPEQIWDTDGIPDRGLSCGRPSGSAMPLAWAHAEFIKLARSIVLGHPIDRPEAAWERYQGIRPRRLRATWRFEGQRPTMPGGVTLRLETLAPARVHCSLDGWRTTTDVEARDTGLGVWTCDVPGSAGLPPGAAVVFTFFWPAADGGEGRWEGRDFEVVIGSPEEDAGSVPSTVESAAGLDPRV